ncbi:hypothetical protein CRG98_026486 [Punica granatum]|uniref:Uncharacterized protein n=1 Tax=Punica granatum TaxID=22663 RepID=A0A2I0JA48_PUNGR|nr:hypothetical protein CRG98_026486 [Punica granatum]
MGPGVPSDRSHAEEGGRWRRRKKKRKDSDTVGRKKEEDRVDSADRLIAVFLRTGDRCEPIQVQELISCQLIELERFLSACRGYLDFVVKIELMQNM